MNNKEQETSKLLTEQELEDNIKLYNNDYHKTDLDNGFVQDMILLIHSQVEAAVNNWSIMGKKPEEVYLILRALEFERIADIKVTMNNLDAITKLIQEDIREANQRAINNAFERFKK